MRRPCIVHDDRAHRSQLLAQTQNADVKSLLCGRTGVETTGQKTDIGVGQSEHDGQEAVVLVEDVPHLMLLLLGILFTMSIFILSRSNLDAS